MNGKKQAIRLKRNESWNDMSSSRSNLTVTSCKKKSKRGQLSPFMGPRSDPRKGFSKCQMCRSDPKRGLIFVGVCEENLLAGIAA